MNTITSREIRLKSRPEGMPTADNFELAAAELPAPSQDELLVKNLYMSVDPYMRGRMIDRQSYLPPFQINEPLEGGSVGEVVESNNQNYNPGDMVLGMLGWREYFVSNGQGLMRFEPGDTPLQAFLGTLGMTGLTAYSGLLEVGKPTEGQTVFVSAASGAVGSIVSQIAKIKGCFVVGSAGSDEKVAWLKDVAGVDEAFNYKTVDNLFKTVDQCCPNGIDIYFENVGGKHLEAALEYMNPQGRLVMCGMISQYNATKPPQGPSNLGYVVAKQLTMQGFLVGNYFHKMHQFQADMGKWVAEGRISWKETVLEGIEKAPEAFIGLFKGENFGKMIVKL
jgi:NADPH-dependent curcumin reductase CurA